MPLCLDDNLSTAKRVGIKYYSIHTSISTCLCYSHFSSISCKFKFE